MPAKKAKKPVSYPRVVIAGASKSKFLGRRGSPLMKKSKLPGPPTNPGGWSLEDIQKGIRGPNWDVKWFKSDGALAFGRILGEAGLLKCLEAAIAMVPREGYDGYFNKRAVLFGLLRKAIATASDADFAAAEALAEAGWEDNSRISRAIACLFPHRQDWGQKAADLAEVEWEVLKAAKGYDPAPYDLRDHALLLGAAISPERMLGFVEKRLFQFFPETESWWVTWVEQTGVGAAPVLAAFHHKHNSGYYETPMGRVIALVESAETAAAAAQRLGDWKKVEKAEVKFLKTIPSLAIPALEAEIARYKGGMQRQRAWNNTEKLAGAARARALLAEIRAEFKEATAPTYDRSGLPKGLDKSPWSAKRKEPGLPLFFSPANLPPLKLTGQKKALPPSMVREIGAMMKDCAPDKPLPGMKALIANTDPAMLAAFEGAVRGQWEAAGGETKEIWAAQWAGALGGDDALEALAEATERWCQMNRHKRSFEALEAFVLHPTDRSALLLERSSRKSRFDGLSHRAGQALHRLAQARGLSSQELLDTIAPDCGLTDWPRTLDYGHRTFTAGFDAALNPWVKDADGKPVKDAPRPGKRDAASAGPARRHWMSTKAAVRAQARDQLSRLEAAMVNERRWTPDGWRAFAAHPLLGLLARGLVWGLYPDGKLAGTFRLDESGAPVDAGDEPVPVDAPVGLVHPVQLPLEVLAAWATIFTDYEQVQPILQLQRARYLSADAEAIVAALTGATVRTSALMGLRRKGWSKGPEEGAGLYHSLDGGPISVGFDPGLDVIASAQSFEEQTLSSVLVSDYADRDSVALSEALADLVALGSS